MALATVLGSVPANAAPLRALPATVRVNVGGLIVTSARFGAYGPFTATAPDGKVLYEGTGTVAVRTNVWRIRGGARLPDRSTLPADRDERASRLAAVREARQALAAAGPEPLELVRFELTAPTAADPVGAVLVRSVSVVGVRFSSDSLLTFNGRVFRGSLELSTDDVGDMIAINTVDTGAYLASVVGSEIPSSWHPEALAAQAIAARTYLATHLGRHARYDLEGDTRDQQYDGVGAETTSTVRAVERTAGIVATYRGAPIEALYSANAGGITEDSENVYENALPYLRSVPSPTDQFATTSSWGASSWEWTKEWSAPKLGEQLKRRGMDVGDVERIDVLARSESGRVLQARVIGSRTSADIGKDRSRTYFGLLSTLFTVERRGGDDVEAVPLADARRTFELEQLGARVVDVGYRVSRDDGEHAVFVRSSLFYRLPARFVFTGKGFGHGVGMSQWGMEGLAEAGSGYEAILKHYYTGIALTKAGGD